MTPIVKYRILQYNVLHQKKGWTRLTHLFEMPFLRRAENVARAITDCAPDIVMLAERHDEWSGVAAGAMDGAVDLVALLGGAYAMIEDRITYKEETVVNRVPIAYRTDVFRLVDSGFLRLSEECSFQQSQNKRVVTWAILEDVRDAEPHGARIAVFNTHWSFAQYNGTSYESIRQAQTKETQKLINSEKFRGLPVVAGGDYNAVYSESIYLALLQGCGLHHADMTANGRITYNNVDHIAVAGAKVASYVVHKADEASDHEPIYCDIEIHGGYKIQ